MQWINRQITRLKKGKKTSSKKKEERSHKMTLNALIIANRDIMPGIATQNRSKTEKLKRKSKP
jgi:hypothetical protein